MVERVLGFGFAFGVVALLATGHYLIAVFAVLGLAGLLVGSVYLGAWFLSQEFDVFARVQGDEE